MLYVNNTTCRKYINKRCLDITTKPIDITAKPTLSHIVANFCLVYLCYVFFITPKDLINLILTALY